jgi:hypothetical protein
VQEGLAEITALVSLLSFIKNKRKWGVYLQGTPANMRRPISEFDYKLIHEAMKLNPLPKDISTLFPVKRRRRKKERDELN